MNENAVVSNEVLGLFSQRGELKNCQPGVELFRQGHAINNVYLLEHGLVKHTYTNKHGSEMVLELRLPGRVLGAASAILCAPALVTSVTLTECRIYRLSVEAFLNVVETNIRFSQRILRAISRQFYEQVQRQVQLGAVPARSRLAHILLQFIPESASGLDEEIRLQLPVSNTDLAGLLAIAPSYLSRLLGKLEEKGAIRRSKGWIYVSVDLLKQEAE